METSIRLGMTVFYDHTNFPYGLSRSSYFNKRESQELQQYGFTFKGLQDGSLSPVNEEELRFITDLNSVELSNLYPVQLWKKYLAAVESNKIFHGFSPSCSSFQGEYNFESDLMD